MEESTPRGPVGGDDRREPSESLPDDHRAGDEGANAEEPEEVLSDEEQREEDMREGHERSSTRVQVIHAAVREDGEAELHRPTGALAFSGLAAGMSMSFSFLAEALLKSMLPDAEWASAIAKLGYGVGFLIVILGRQQLFTENTLTVILPLMHRKTWHCLVNVLRLWATVLVSNLVGGIAVAWVLANSAAVSKPVQAVLGELGTHAADPSFGTLLLRGIFAGWLIALLVWLLPAAEVARVWVILIITYLVAIGQFSHVVVGTIEVAYAAFQGEIGYAAAFAKYLPAALIGNIIGGVSLTAAVNHAQVVAGGQDGVNR